jgi:hypothetical protein
MTLTLLASRQKPIIRLERWHHGPKRRRMGIMAIDAAFALPWTARQIPVTCHASVRTMLVIAGLRSMALGAERLHLREVNGAAFGQTQAAIFGGRVTGNAPQFAVMKLKSLVKSRELLALSCRRVGLQIGMTARTSNGYFAAECIELTGRDTGRTLWPAHHDWMEFRPC